MLRMITELLEKQLCTDVWLSTRIMRGC